MTASVDDSRQSGFVKACPGRPAFRNRPAPPQSATLASAHNEGHDFAGGRVESTCSLTLSEPTLLAPSESCALVEAFIPHEDFAGIKQDQIWLATATDPATGAVLETRESVFFGRGR
jgi:hypothetical protein